MTESLEELQRIRRALLDAAAVDYHQALAAAPADVPPSRAYRRWRRRLLRNPQGLLRQQARPPWARALRGVACAVLALSLTFGAVMMVSPEARAAVSRWFVVHFSDHVSYQFSGEMPVQSIGRWAPTYLPDGYVQTEYIDLTNLVSILYSNGDPEMDIEFSYQLLTDGGGENLDNEWHEISSLSIHGMPASLFTATEENGLHMLLWFDEANEHSFLLLSRIDSDILIRMAESVTSMAA